jgi:hypothetical protein
MLAYYLCTLSAYLHAARKMHNAPVRAAFNVSKHAIMYVFCFLFGMVCDASPCGVQCARLDLARCQELSGPLFVQAAWYICKLQLQRRPSPFFRFPGRFFFFCRTPLKRSVCAKELSESFFSL